MIGQWERNNGSNIYFSKIRVAHLRSLVVYIVFLPVDSYGPSYSNFTVYPANSCFMALINGYFPVPQWPRKSSISTDHIITPPNPSSFNHFIYGNRKNTPPRPTISSTRSFSSSIVAVPWFLNFSRRRNRSIGLFYTRMALVARCPTLMSCFPRVKSRTPKSRHNNNYACEVFGTRRSLSV